MSTKTMAHYLIIMFMVMLLIFRFVVLFTTVLGIDFPITVANENFEIVMILVSLICIILFTIVIIGNVILIPLLDNKTKIISLLLIHFITLNI